MARCATPTKNHRDRREKKRFAIHVIAGIKLLAFGLEIDKGTAAILDISSSGVAFQSGCHLQPGQRVKLSADWPAVLESGLPLQLRLSGIAIRSREDGFAAVRIQSYEFHIRSRSAAAQTGATGA